MQHVTCANAQSKKACKTIDRFLRVCHGGFDSNYCLGEVDMSECYRIEKEPLNVECGAWIAYFVGC
jgi:hypothetical protein